MSSVSLVLVWLAQVPDPNGAGLVASALKNVRSTILDQESTRLRKLARALEAEGQRDEAAIVLKRIPDPPPRDGTITFRPLLEVVPAAANPAKERMLDAALKIEDETCKSLFKLADEAASTQPGHYALAETCLRDVLARQPDHAPARRLLGFEPFQGGWATPYAAAQIKSGKTFHEVYGWVKKSWVPHLEKGELPARAVGGANETWLPAAEADAQRRDFAHGWEISTEHFGIQTNVPLSEAIHFGQRLEVLHEVFQFLMADVIGEKLPLAMRFKNPERVGEFGAPPHIVSYFATRDEYIDAIRPLQGDEVATVTLGIYLPSAKLKGKGGRGRAYTFRDPDGVIDVFATLCHEVSHQLLFESGVVGPQDFLKNVGNYWVFEGLGTFFESLTFHKDGTLTIGGMNGRRLEEARRTFRARADLVPFPAFVRLDEAQFNKRPGIYRNYQQGNALATFLMTGEQGAYRDGFLSYVKDAAKGLVRQPSNRSLEARIDKPLAELEDELIGYLHGAR
jgi:Protein of unknown function (DUF1570)